MSERFDRLLELEAEMNRTRRALGFAPTYPTAVRRSADYEAAKAACNAAVAAMTHGELVEFAAYRKSKRTGAGQ